MLFEAKVLLGSLSQFEQVLPLSFAVLAQLHTLLGWLFTHTLGDLSAVQDAASQGFPAMAGLLILQQELARTLQILDIFEPIDE
jgi:hypothetical protein